MDTIGREELGNLIRHRHEHCVSIYMPTHRAGPPVRQDRIRLKNLLREAVERLEELGMCRHIAKRMLKPAEDLLDDSFFWRHQGDGLALFISPETFHSYRLPVAFGDILIVTGSFHVKPLLPVFGHDSHYYLLSLSNDGARLFRGSPSALVPLELPSAPSSLHEVLLRFAPEKLPTISASKAVPQFCERVEAAVASRLDGQRAPLILASTLPLKEAYRKVNTYPYFVQDWIPGSMQSVGFDEIAARAEAVARGAFRSAERAAIARYQQYAGKLKASDEIGPVLWCANEGLVDTLLVAVGRQRWGTFDPSSEAVAIHDSVAAGDEDLLNRAAILTILHGGDVFAVPPSSLPGEGPLAAILRY